MVSHIPFLVLPLFALLALVGRALFALCASLRHRDGVVNSFPIYASGTNPRPRSHNEFLLEVQRRHGSVPPISYERHGGIGSPVNISVKDPSSDNRNVRTTAEKVPPPLFASKPWAIAAEEAAVAPTRPMPSL